MRCEEDIRSKNFKTYSFLGDDPPNAESKLWKVGTSTPAPYWLIPWQYTSPKLSSQQKHHCGSGVVDHDRRPIKMAAGGQSIWGRMQVSAITGQLAEDARVALHKYIDQRTYKVKRVALAINLLYKFRKWHLFRIL